jgi:hypothetical protein
MSNPAADSPAARRRTADKIDNRTCRDSTGDGYTSGRHRAREHGQGLVRNGRRAQASRDPAGVAKPALSYGEVVTPIANLVLGKDAGQPVASDPIKPAVLVVKDAGREPSSLTTEDPYPRAPYATPLLPGHLAMIAAGSFPDRSAETSRSAQRARSVPYGTSE